MLVGGFPGVKADGFVGVDWTNDRERVPLGGLIEADGWRITREGNLQTVEGLEDVAINLSGNFTLDALYYPTNDDIEVVSFTSTTAYLDEVNKALSSLTAIDNWTFSAGNELCTLEEMYERLFIQLYQESLRVWTGSGATSVLASADTDLDDDGDATDTLDFAGISAFDGHLIGYGYGDETGSGGEETADLGPDRPEVLRWSHLGQPIKWRPENWIMVGSRGQPILSATPALGRLLVLKPMGAFLVYGDLEQNFPQLEQLQEDKKGRNVGSVGPKAAAVMDGFAYWLSPAGPMRWTGGARAEYLGTPTQDSLLAEFRSSTSFVVPVPEWDAVLFCSPMTNAGPSFDGVGAAPTPGASPRCRCWIWDVRKDAWAGRFAVGGEKISAAVAPDSNFRRRVVWHGETEFADDTRAQSAGSFQTGSSGTSGYLRTWRTPEIMLVGGRHALLRGVLVRGGWSNDTEIEFDWSLYADETRVELQRLYLQNAAPVANSTGDLWYDLDDDVQYQWDGSAWKKVRGLEENMIRFPTAGVRARTARFVLQQRAEQGGNGTQELKSYSFQATPI